MTVSSNLLGVFLHGVAASRPAANAVAGGTIYSATDTGAITQSDGSSWATFATISSGLVDPMTTRGDMMVRNASNVTARVAIGSAGKVWMSDGTDPSWQTPGASSPAKHGCSVANNGTQTIATATDTAITFDTEDFDTDAYHSTGSNTDRVTIPSGMDGLYVIVGSVFWAANGTGIRQIYIDKGGTPVRDNRVIAGGTTIDQQVSHLAVLAAADIIRLRVYHEAGGNLNAGAAGPNYVSCRLQLALIGT